MSDVVTFGRHVCTALTPEEVEYGGDLRNPLATVLFIYSGFQALCFLFKRDLADSPAAAGSIGIFVDTSINIASTRQQHDVRIRAIHRRARDRVRQSKKSNLRSA